MQHPIWVPEVPELVRGETDGCPVSVAIGAVPPAHPRDRRRVVTGWGLTAEEAFRRCWYEAAERFSAGWFGSEPVRTAVARELGREAVLPDEVQLFDDRQYEDRMAWNRRHPGGNEVPVRWRKERPIAWLSGNPALGSDTSWLPAGLCLLGHPDGRAAGLISDSSGAAAGASAADAAVRAFLELVERDAVAIWWFNEIVRPRLRPDRLADPLVDAYLDFAARQGRRFWLLDLTHDFGIPVVAAVSCSASSGADLALGFGIDPWPAGAARHAIGELAQFELNMATIATRKDSHGAASLLPEARAMVCWRGEARLDRLPFLKGAAPEPDRPARLPLDLPACRALCRSKGLRFAALDLTRPGCGTAVARVVVPGLRPKWARFAPGRLYDVPVQMGWRTTPSRPFALNSLPLPG